MTEHEYWIGKNIDYRSVWQAYEDGVKYIGKFRSMRVHLLRIELTQFPADQALFNHEAVYKTIKGYFHDFKQHCLSDDEYISAGPLFLYSVDRGSGIWNFLGQPRQLLAFGATLADGKILGQELENVEKKLEILQKDFAGLVDPKDFKKFMRAKSPKDLILAVEKLVAQGIRRVDVSQEPFQGSMANTAKSLINLTKLLQYPNEPKLVVEGDVNLGDKIAGDKIHANRGGVSARRDI